MMTLTSTCPDAKGKSQQSKKFYLCNILFTLTTRRSIESSLQTKRLTVFTPPCVFYCALLGHSELGQQLQWMQRERSRSAV